MRHIVEHNPETVALLIECWEARNPVRETAKICGISEKGVYRWYQRHGYTRTDDAGPVRVNGIPPHIGEEIIDLRCSGLSFRELSRRYKYNKQTIANYIRKRGFR